ncbi:phage integrase N-terminal domain-containing protein [Larsenimonas salina]|uniref:phage integrase N-terminal domain-containing protein n=1 Tax=Larsenimonas salina TaxID=1295565 RepID=UPI002073FEFB|nr:phage integrase N-terminal domain-containing protein [Larsenimonas salina]MCM5705828.1 integrase domain-containing protein [Larsenimonas salina]
MNKLGFDFMQLCQRNRDGSQTTQYQRSRSLRSISQQLQELGYRNMRASSLKPKHVTALVERWQGEGISDGTIKNRMAHVRWWAEKVGKTSVIPRDNTQLGIRDRVHVTGVSKAQTLDPRLEAVPDHRIRVSLELQAAFGLRREESMKLRPALADHGDRLVLQGSWTKGGREREIPIETDDQRAVLDRAHQVAGTGSLIPPTHSYAQHLKRYEYLLPKAGLSRMHGLRHAYAQRRYETLTGWAAPAAGGPVSSALSADQRASDQQARLTISRELGHEREQVTAIYLGR